MNDSMQSRKNQALALLRSNHLTEAKLLYSAICQEIPRDADSWNFLAAAHGMLGEFREAEACCRKVIFLRPDAVGTYNNLGNALKFQGKIKEAEECYREALRLMPEYAEAHNNLGNLLKDQGQHHQAESCYRQAITCAPNYADAHSNLGIIQRDQGKLEEAITNYRHALQIDPNHRDAQYNLGHALCEQGEYAASMAVYEQLTRLCPQDIRSWSALCMMYDQLGEHDKAIASGRQAIERGHDNADAHFTLGSVWHHLGQRDKAKEMYERALTLDPNMTKARYFLSRLNDKTAPAKPPAQYIIELFDELAHRFDRHLVGQLGYQAPELLHKAVTQMLGDKGKDLTILDLGCGTGLAGAPFRNIAKHLSGVDLSPKMIQKARERKIYDELIVGDLLMPLRGSDPRYDLIIAADVFIYIGDLSEVFAACQITLRPGGLFAFSTESEEITESYVLRSTERYAHSPSYIQTLATTSGFMVAGIEKLILRHESGKPVEGRLFFLQKPLHTN